MKNHNVFLIGLMGTGKTSIGQYIARELGLVFYDTDAVIVERTGADVSWIFDLEGEEGFRQREATALAELSQLEHIVLATGGGVVIRSDNRRYLHDNGIVIYLRASIDQLLVRTGKNRHRPLLNNDNPRETYERLLTQRQPLYEEIANLTYDTDDYTVAELGNVIVTDLRRLYEF